MNTSLRLSKYKLHHKPFNTACSGKYSEGLDGMPLILILLQNDSPTPPPVNVCLGLGRCYFWLMVKLIATCKLRMTL